MIDSEPVTIAVVSGVSSRHMLGVFAVRENMEGSHQTFLSERSFVIVS